MMNKINEKKVMSLTDEQLEAIAGGGLYDYLERQVINAKNDWDNFIDDIKRGS